MSEVNKLIEISKKEVGYLEKKSNKNLDSKTEKQKDACDFLRELAVFLLERNY